MSGRSSEEYREEEGAEQSVTDVEVLPEICDRHRLNGGMNFSAGEPGIAPRPNSSDDQNPGVDYRKKC
jgi:hypothetical protein